MLATPLSNASFIGFFILNCLAVSLFSQTAKDGSKADTTTKSSTAKPADEPTLASLWASIVGGSEEILKIISKPGRGADDEIRGSVFVLDAGKSRILESSRTGYTAALVAPNLKQFIGLRDGKLEIVTVGSTAPPAPIALPSGEDHVEAIADWKPATAEIIAVASGRPYRFQGGAWTRLALRRTDVLALTQFPAVDAKGRWLNAERRGGNWVAISENLASETQSVMFQSPKPVGKPVWVDANRIAFIQGN